MTTQAAAQRLRATPFARRLARERAIPLAAITGSGPYGRIVAQDLEGWIAPSPIAAPATAPSADPAPVSRQDAPSFAAAALDIRVDFSAAELLLARIAEVRPAVDRMDIVLKAAALGLAALPGPARDGILLLSPSQGQTFLTGLAGAPIGMIAMLRSAAPAASGAAGGAGAALAVSFVGRPRLRPVAARLTEPAPARLTVGFGTDGIGHCLLSYHPAGLRDADAEALLCAFAELIETPMRLLV